MIAGKRGHLPVVEALLAGGADPNAALNDVRYRALHTASQEGYEEIVVALLDGGASINAATQYGETALISAAYHGKTAMVRLLLGRGADPRKTDRQGHKAVDWARRYGHIETADVLEEASGSARPTSSAGLLSDGPEQSDQTSKGLGTIGSFIGALIAFRLTYGAFPPFEGHLLQWLANDARAQWAVGAGLVGVVVGGLVGQVIGGALSRRV